MKLTLLCLALAGCLDQADETADTEQALNGDTWTTVDDNPYNQGTGASYTAIASSPTTHTILATGYRYETDGSTTAIVRESTTANPTFTLNSTFKLGTGKSSAASAVTADSQGNWYVAGWAIGTDNFEHFIVRKSMNGGGIWATLLDETGHVSGDYPYGLTVDNVSGALLLSATTYSGGQYHAIIKRSTSYGTGAWTTVLDYPAATSSAVAQICEDFTQNETLYAIGWSDIYMNGWKSTDHGATWAQSALHYHQGSYSSRAYACSVDFNGNVDIAGRSLTSSGTAIWDGEIFDSALNVHKNEDAYAGVASPFNVALGVTNSISNNVGYAYYVGQTYDRGIMWTTRRIADGAAYSSASFSDKWQLAPNKSARARAVAWDGVRGTYAVGEATDASNRLHGIVRHLPI